MLLAALVPGLVGCPAADEPEAVEDTQEPAARERLSVYVVNYPLQYFAERIGGERVEVTFPAPGDVDPADWMPDTSTIRAYQRADVTLLHGADYARWRGLVSLPTDVTVDTSAHFRDRLLEVPDAYVHAHGPDGEMHAHAGVASVTWLDPTLAIEHARAIKRALVEQLPADADAFTRRFEALADDWREIDGQLEAVFGGDADWPVLASEPVYHYLAARYGLEVESMQWQPDRMPDDAQWSALDEKLEHHAAQAMLWPREPMPEIASRLAERDVAVVVFAPSARRPETGDLLEVMRGNVANLRAAWGDIGD